MPTRFPAQELCAIALQAGARILQIREAGGLDTQRKGDGSPVTLADHASQAMILAGLHALTPDIPVIAEEKDNSGQMGQPRYWLVDPLDGTRDFLTGRDDFSVNIGLIENGIPVLGVVYAPARDDLVFGSPHETFRILNGLQTPLAPTPSQTPPRLTISVRDAKLHPLADWQEQNQIAEANIRASAYKLALVAVGEADLFLRTSVTYEWDTAAGDALLRAQGGAVITPDGKPLAYQKRDLTNGALAAFRTDFDRALLPLFW